MSILHHQSKKPKPYETRPDWCFCHPTRKREAWQADFNGVTRLSSTQERYWVNVWRHPEGFTLRLQSKDALGTKTPPCQLLPTGPGQYATNLVLSEELSLREVPLRIQLWETSEGCLRVHFELIEWGHGK
jgi:hypothetical protein